MIRIATAALALAVTLSSALPAAAAERMARVCVSNESPVTIWVDAATGPEGGPITPTAVQDQVVPPHSPTFCFERPANRYARLTIKRQEIGRSGITRFCDFQVVRPNSSATIVATGQYIQGIDPFRCSYRPM